MYKVTIEDMETEEQHSYTGEMVICNVISLIIDDDTCITQGQNAMLWQESMTDFQILSCQLSVLKTHVGKIIEQVNDSKLKDAAIAFSDALEVVVGELH